MTVASITPLRKKGKKNGDLYARPPEIEGKLLEVVALSRGELSMRCAIVDADDPNYLPSECLVYLVREHRTRAFDDCSEVLFATLMGRVLAVIPSGLSANGDFERTISSNVRDECRHRFIEMLMKDRAAYEVKLDFYEVRFGLALASLLTTCKRKVYREEFPLDGLEVDSESGEISSRVEKAAERFSLLEKNKLDDDSYRLKVEKAIDTLPPFEKAIVELILKGIPIESKIPGTIDMVQLLNKTEKTIRNYRDMAFASLRRMLTEGENT